MIQQLLIGFTFSVFFSLASYFAKFLTLSGSIAQCILGTILLGFGGWQWTVPMLVFFLLSSVMSKIGGKQKQSLEHVFEKSSQRDAGQVFANGGIAGIVTLAWLSSGHEALYVAYLGSVAAATADTCGTELGSLSRLRPVLITSLRSTEHGRSGAVSLLGLVSGVTGALAIFVCGAYWLHDSLVQFALISVVLGGIAGALADSLIGGTIQAQYLCPICDQTTERRLHCGIQTEKTRGVAWITNDLVNLACTSLGALVSLLCFLFLCY